MANLTLSERLLASLDDVARAARRHRMDDPIHDEILALYCKLLARKNKADVSYAAQRRDNKTIGT